MWALAAIALILIFSGGVLGFNEECTISLHNGCQPQQWPSNFPQSDTELETSCRSTRNNLNCLLDLNQACNLDQERIQYLVNAVDFFNKECDSRSSIFKAISRDLDCLYSALPKVNDVCHEDYISKMWKKSAKDHVKENYSRNYAEDDIETCLDGIWEDVCTVSIIGEECQMKTAEAALVVLFQMDYRISTCQEDIISEITTFGEATDLEESIEDSITLLKLIERYGNNN